MIDVIVPAREATLGKQMERMVTPWFRPRRIESRLSFSASGGLSKQKGEGHISDTPRNKAMTR